MTPITPLQLIALNLPQFHPIPENDQWWGKGFTEWANVAKARPLFKGHYQPHLPADLGFYDLRLPEARQAQAELAKAYGIGGFCYYHYWFNGRRLLERPVNEIFQTGEPNFPFCLCWANENWTRTWDGHEKNVLMGQSYSEEDDMEHVRSLIPLFADKRYIRIDGKPIFLVYRANRLPSPARTADLWRREAEAAGLPGLYLIRVESFPDETGDPANLGFDAALEFQPKRRLVENHRVDREKWWHRRRLGTHNPVFTENVIVDYDELVKRALASRWPDYPYIRCVCPSWDNCARRQTGAFILRNSTPQSYGLWLRGIIGQTLSMNQGSVHPKTVFINAWNEWGEGNHLEPCSEWGCDYLEETKRAFATIVGT